MLKQAEIQIDARLHAVVTLSDNVEGFRDSISDLIKELNKKVASGRKGAPRITEWSTNKNRIVTVERERAHAMILRMKNVLV